MTTTDNTPLSNAENTLLALLDKWTGMYIPAADTVRAQLARDLEAKGLVTVEPHAGDQLYVALINPPKPVPVPRLIADAAPAESQMPRYTGFITQQLDGKSYIQCPEFPQLIRFFTIDAEGEIQIGSRVEFDINFGDYLPLAENVSVVDQISAQPAASSVVEALRRLDIDSLSPVEALTALRTLKRLAGV